MQFQYIQQQREIQQLSEQLTEQSCVFIDTEFQRRHTYYAKLGLLQLNLDGQIYLCDGHLDLTPIWQKISGHQQNVFHSCSEDLALIYQYAQCDALNNVFDTQVALSYLGYGTQIGYQNAVERILQQDVDKEEKCSDWLARPLTVSQKTYAASDVYYLPALLEYSTQRLKEKQQYEYCLEDCQNLAAEIKMQNQPEYYYQGLTQFRYTVQQNLQIKQLCDWREQLAIKLNCVRSQILGDQEIRALVELLPHSKWQLFGNDYGIKPKTLRHYGEHILTLLHDLPDENEWYDIRPLRSFTPSAEQKIILKDYVQNIANQTGIPSDVLLKKRWLHSIGLEVRNQLSQSHRQNLISPYLLGWRKKIVTEPILAMCLEFAKDQEHAHIPFKLEKPQ